MKHLLKTTIAAVLLSISIQTIHATRIIQDLVIVNGDTTSLLAVSLPLDSYLFEKGMTDSDIPWMNKNYCADSVTNTGLARGYRATWLLENDSLFLVKIENKLSKFPGYLYSIDYDNKRSIHYDNKYSGDLSNADLRAMFGEKYKNGKVFADWFTGELFTQYGYIVSDLIITMQSIEIKHTVNKGIIRSTKKYPTLTGENTPNAIRIWNGEKLDVESAKEKIYSIVSKNFRWSKEMTKNKDITLTIRIGNNFSNTVLSPKQEELMSTKDLIVLYQNDKEYYENKEPKEAFDIRKIKNATESITECENRIPLKKKEAEEEYEKDKVYLDELFRILKPLKIETVLYAGKQHIFKEFQLHFRMDAKNKTITKDTSKKSY